MMTAMIVITDNTRWTGIVDVSLALASVSSFASFVYSFVYSERNEGASRRAARLSPSRSLSLPRSNDRSLSLFHRLSPETDDVEPPVSLSDARGVRSDQNPLSANRRDRAAWPRSKSSTLETEETSASETSETSASSVRVSASENVARAFGGYEYSE